MSKLTPDKKPTVKIKHLGKKKFKVNWINWHQRTLGLDVTEGVIPEGKVQYTFDQVVF